MNEQIERVEISIEQANEAIKRREQLKALTKNKDFQAIIDTGYFVEEASRVVMLKGNPAFQSEEMQNSVENQLIAIAFLRQYFSTIMQIGRSALDSKEADEQTLVELHEEELANNA